MVDQAVSRHRAPVVSAHSLAIVAGMSKSERRHPFRKLMLIAAVIAAVVAVRNAIADKGGSYDPDGSA